MIGNRHVFGYGTSLPSFYKRQTPRRQSFPCFLLFGYWYDYDCYYCYYHDYHNYFFLPCASVSLSSRINTLMTPSGTSSTPSSKPGLTPIAM
jgi:hypothetical protein